MFGLFTGNLNELTKDLEAGFEKGLEDAAKETSEGWKAEIVADADLGGAKLEANEAIVAKAMDSLGSQKLRDFFEATAREFQKQRLVGQGDDLMRGCPPVPPNRESGTVVPASEHDR